MAWLAAVVDREDVTKTTKEIISLGYTLEKAIEGPQCVTLVFEK